MGSGDKPWTFWRVVKVVFVSGLALLFGIVLLSVVVALLSGRAQTPKCDEAEVQRKVVQSINQQLEALLRLAWRADAAEALRTEGLMEARELYFDKESGYRACVAKTRGGNRQGITGYTIEWADKSSGTYVIRIKDANALLSQYGDKAANATASAPTSPAAKSSSDCMQKKLAEYDAEIKARLAGGEAIPDERIASDRQEAEAFIAEQCKR